MLRYKVFVLASFALISCGKTSFTTVSIIPDASEVLAPAVSPLGFAELKSTIFSARCVSCHAQYETYEGVRLELDAIDISVRTDRMPKSGPHLSGEHKALLARWIADGAPERAGDPAAPLPPRVLEPKLASIHKYIFAPKCIVCHSPAGKAKFLDLSTPEAIAAAADREFGGIRLFDFENPAASYLLEILRDPDEPMPPISSRIPRLTNEELSVIEAWIGANVP